MQLEMAILCFLSGALAFEQHDFHLKFERVEAVRNNVDYISKYEIANFKYNRTHAVINVTVNFEKDFGNEMQVQFQAYRFASNEYRLFPLRYMDNFCKVLARNDYGMGGMYTCGHFPKCPMVKGHYFVCNFAPNGTKFPPHIPNGRTFIFLLAGGSSSNEYVWCCGSSYCLSLNYYYLS